jgi:hypothetical protein
MRLLTLAALLSLAVPAAPLALGQSPTQGNYAIPRRAAIFIEEMPEGLDTFIAAEIVRRNLPLRLVPRREDAELLMVGTATVKPRKWHEGFLTGPVDSAVGSVKIVASKTGELVWVGAAGDKTFWTWFKRPGLRRVAQLIVRQMARAIR